MSSETIALFVAGIVWPFVFQWLGKLGLDGKAAQGAAVLLCYVIAAVVVFTSGGAITPESVIVAGSPVATLALVIYRQVIKPEA